LNDVLYILTMKSKQKYKPTGRIKRAQEHLDVLMKRISPYIKPYKWLRITTEGQWEETEMLNNVKFIEKQKSA